MRHVLFLTLFLLAMPVAAQDEPIPDTTEAWRYFPMEVGNVWEYDCLGSTCDQKERRSVPSDTVISGKRYFAYRVEQFDLDGHPLGQPHTYHLRFDSLTATVDGTGHPRTFMTLCPLDAPFGAALDCDGDQFTETGTHGGPETVTIGSDVVQTTRKAYAIPGSLYESFLEGVGFMQTYWPGIDVGLTLAYARVGGVEYGEPVILAAEGGIPGVGLTLNVYPNPFTETLTLRSDLGVPEAVRVEVFDALGRLIHAEERIAGGATTIRLDASGWPSGLYLVRLGTSEGRTVTARIVRR